MKNNKITKVASIPFVRNLVLLTSAIFGLTTTTSAQIYAGGAQSTYIGEYNFNGSTVNANLISTAYEPWNLEIFGTTLYSCNHDGSLGVYNLDGTVVSTNFLVGGGAFDVALSGTTLYATAYSSYVSTYNASTGAQINPHFIVLNPDTNVTYTDTGIAISGNHLFVAEGAPGIIEEYDATTGALIQSNFITGLHSPNDIKISGNDLFVLNQSDSIGEYDATTGAAINANLITGVPNESAFALSGTNIFVSSYTTPGVSEWTTSGQLVNSALFNLPGVNLFGYGIAATPQAVPEPATWGMLLGGLAMITLVGRRRRQIA